MLRRQFIKCMGVGLAYIIFPVKLEGDYTLTRSFYVRINDEITFFTTPEYIIEEVSSCGKYINKLDCKTVVEEIDNRTKKVYVYENKYAYLQKVKQNKVMRFSVIAEADSGTHSDIEITGKRHI